MTAANHNKADEKAKVQTLHVRFPSAREVYIMGEFNNWSTTATPLVRLGDGVWEVKLSVTHALRRLCFFVWDHGQRFGHVVEAQVQIIAANAAGSRLTSG